MKPGTSLRRGSLLLALGVAALASAPLSGKAFMDGPDWTGPILRAGDFDGDGAPDLALWQGGRLWIQYRTGRPDGAWQSVPLDDHAWFHTLFIHVADLNGDGRDDLALAHPDANRVLVLFGPERSETQPGIRIVPLAGGPMDWAVGFGDGRDAAESLTALALETPTPYLATIFGRRDTLPGDPGALEIRRRLFPAGEFPGHGSLGVASMGDLWPGINTNVVELTWHHQPPRTGPEVPVPQLSLFRGSEEAAGLAKIGDVTLKRGTMGLLDTRRPGDPPTRATLVAWGPGLSELLVIPWEFGEGRLPEVASIPFEYDVLSWQSLPRARFDGRFLVARDLTREQAVYRWSATGLLERVDSATPPEGQDFAQPGVWTGEGLATLLQPTGDPMGDGGPTAIGHYALRDGRLIFEGTSPLPAMASRPVVARVLVYDRDPFADARALEFARLAAGDWTRGAQVQDGAVTASTATYRDSVLGLGGDTSRSLPLPGRLPGTAFALANQWEPTSSLHFQAGPAAMLTAAVGVAPSPGSYPGPIAVTFSSAPDVVVVSRVEAGPWQTGPGPASVPGTATVSFYGVDPSGIAGPVQTVLYTVGGAAHSQATGEANDRDRDGLDDAWERRFFGSLAADPEADDDGDGFTNRQEHDAGTHPLDPTSRPDGDPTPVERPLLGLAVAANGAVSLSWQGPAGARFTVQTSDTLPAWVPSPVAPEYGDGVHRWTDPEPLEGTRFYRVVREP
ncbi:MAG: VCBS repeat-containing protein [Verrucomicrobiae bacterium]|nr:VCBS repeat-containing protein [Verrucomicrobiae bacterium]